MNVAMHNSISNTSSFLLKSRGPTRCIKHFFMYKTVSLHLVITEVIIIIVM